MTPFLTIPCQYWDFAGIDGLQVAKTLFGDAIDRLAPFQSIQTALAQDPSHHCAVLRLCEGNFRVSWQGETALFQQQIALAQNGQRVWVKQLPWLSTVFLTEAFGLLHLPQVAIPKPPCRLQALPLNCAIPTRIDGMAVLIWHHSIQEQPVFELQMAVQHTQPVQASLQASEAKLSHAQLSGVAQA